MWCIINDIASLITKGTTPRGGNVSYLDAGIGFLRAENVDGIDKLNCKDMKFIDKETHKGFLKRSILEENDILITIAGTLGRTAIVRKNDLPLNANQAVSIVRMVNNADINLLYLVYAINSPFIQKSLTEQKKITAIPNLTLEIIANCYLPLPPLAEQHRIVAKIEELLLYIEKYEQTETQLTELNNNFPELLKKSILQEAVQGKLVPQDPNDEPASVLLERIRKEKQELIKAGKIKKDKHESTIITSDKIPYILPNGWVWCRLSDLGEIVGGGTPKTSEVDFWKNGTIPWLTPADMKFVKGKYVNRGERFITQKGLNNSSAQLIPKGSILYSSRAPIGYIAIAQNDICTNQGFKSLVPISTELNEYLYYCLIEKTSEIQSRASGTTFKEISGTEFGNTLIPLPPLSEQHRIVQKIEELMPIINTLSK